MQVTRIEPLTRETCNSLLPLWDEKSSKFLKKSISFHDRFYSWETEAPIGIKSDGFIQSVFFFKITEKRDPKVYSIVNIITPFQFRRMGWAFSLVDYGWKLAKKRGATLFRLNCEQEALGFYNSLGFRYWGWTKSKALFCLMPIIGDLYGYRGVSEEDLALQTYNHPNFSWILRECAHRVDSSNTSNLEILSIRNRWMGVDYSSTVGLTPIVFKDRVVPLPEDQKQLW